MFCSVLCHFVLRGTIIKVWIRIIFIIIFNISSICNRCNKYILWICIVDWKLGRVYSFTGQLLLYYNQKNYKIKTNYIEHKLLIKSIVTIKNLGYIVCPLCYLICIIKIQLSLYFVLIVWWLTKICKFGD